MLVKQDNNENNAYPSNLKQGMKVAPSLKKKGLNLVNANAANPKICAEKSSKPKSEDDKLDCPKELSFPPCENG